MPVKVPAINVMNAKLDTNQIVHAMKNLTDDNVIYIALSQMFDEFIDNGVNSAITSRIGDEDRHWSAGYVYSLKQLKDRIEEIRKSKINETTGEVV